MSNMIMKTPASIDELVMCLKQSDDNTYLLSGGTDLIIKLRNSKIYEGTLIDLTGIDDLKQIKYNAEYIKIGAAATFNQITSNTMLIKHAKCLVQASSQIGSTQIRNAATLGGNIANAFAGADAIPALIALDAMVTILKSDKTTYTKPIDEIIKGSRKNTLYKDEAIIEISIPIANDNCISAFAKLGSRSRVTISKLNIAATAQVKDGTIEAVKIVLGALGTKAFRALSVEKAIENKDISEALYTAFENELVKQVDEAIPNRSSLGYKREAIRGLAEDVYFDLFGSMVRKVKCHD